jgi:hypothetical protein
MPITSASSLSTESETLLRRRPIGDSPSHILLASDWLTTTTFGAAM